MTFTIWGTPQPQGSSRAFVRGGKVNITSANKKLKPWRQECADTLFVQSGCMPYNGDGREAYRVSLDFYLERPPSVPRKRVMPTVKPDLDKLVRAILDAGTGILWKDDAQVVEFSRVRKCYGSPARVELSVEVI